MQDLGIIVTLLYLAANFASWMALLLYR